MQKFFIEGSKKQIFGTPLRRVSGWLSDIMYVTMAAWPRVRAGNFGFFGDPQEKFCIYCIVPFGITSV